MVLNPKDGKEDVRVWTYRDYCNMPDDGNRYEIIDGEMFTNRLGTGEWSDVVLNCGATIYGLLAKLPVFRI